MITNKSNHITEYKTEQSAGFDICANLVDLDLFISKNEDISIESLTNQKDLTEGFKITLRPHQQVIIPTGLFLEFDEMTGKNKAEEYAYKSFVNIDMVLALFIYIRSSIGKKGLELCNKVAVIDADYKDEVFLMIKNTSDKPYEIKNGDRLAQGVFQQVIRPTHMINESKREGGIGSTGI